MAKGIIESNDRTLDARRSLLAINEIFSILEDRDAVRAIPEDVIGQCPRCGEGTYLFGQESVFLCSRCGHSVFGYVSHG
jgi:hypothetical protein